jgi:hypothetical protein
MAEEKKTILLNGGREVDVAIVTKADDFMAQVLGDAPAKSGLVTLQVAKNSAGKPFVAVLMGGKHVGFLSDSDAEDLFPTLDDCEQNGVVAQARGTVTASPDGWGKSVLMLSLAAPGRLSGTPQTQAPAPKTRTVEAERLIEVQPALPMQASKPSAENKTVGTVVTCPQCGVAYTVGATFCARCGCPLAKVPDETLSAYTAVTALSKKKSIFRREIGRGSLVGWLLVIGGLCTLANTVDDFVRGTFSSQPGRMVSLISTGLVVTAAGVYRVYRARSQKPRPAKQVAGAGRAGPPTGEGQITGLFGTCPKCGGANPAGVAFCSRCGQPLANHGDAGPATKGQGPAVSQAQSVSGMRGVSAKRPGSWYGARKVGIIVLGVVIVAVVAAGVALEYQNKDFTKMSLEEVQDYLLEDVHDELAREYPGTDIQDLTGKRTASGGYEGIARGYKDGQHIRYDVSLYETTDGWSWFAKKQ